MLWLSILFALQQPLLTMMTQQLGPAFYGYGFALATAITSVSGLSSSRAASKHSSATPSCSKHNQSGEEGAADSAPSPEPSPRGTR